MLYSSPKQLCFPSVAGQTLRADFDGGALSSDFGPLLLRGIDRQIGLTERLAAFCIATPAEDLPPAAVESARQLILDTIGVALLASSHKIGRLITAHARELGAHAPTASVLGAGNLRVAPVFAAQANGTLANALDYDGGVHLPT